MRYNKKYIERKIKEPLPTLSEDERIYLNVSYMERGFAKNSNCGFDSNKKLWFTGCFNSNLHNLIDLYGVNKETSEKAKQLLSERLKKCN